MTALALLLAAILALLVGALALYVARSTPIDRTRWFDGEGRRLAAGSRAFEETVALLTGTPLRDGNRLELLVNGDETFPRLFADLERADTLITWNVFWFRPGALAERAVEALCARARAGVRVLCLLDAFGSRGLGEAWTGRLRAAGVEVAVFRPLRWRNLYKVQQRLHARSVVIDARLAYTGGFGIGDQWSGDGRHEGSWRDTNLRVEGPLVDDLQAGFVAHWAETSGELLVGRGVFSGRDAADGGTRAGLLRGVPTLGSTAAERMFVLSILGARRRLWITNAYFVPDATLCELLRDAARRGVDVRVLTPGANTDRRSAWLAGRTRFEELLEAGVRLYDYEPAMLHAKTLVADGCWSCVGSLNFDNRSMKLNEEVAVLVADGAFGAELERLFLDDLTRAREVQRAELAGRTRRQRWAEQAARLVAPLL